MAETGGSGVTIKLNCRDCGEPVTWRDDADDADIITCAGCGRAHGPLGQIKAESREKARLALLDFLKDGNQRKD